MGQTTTRGFEEETDRGTLTGFRGGWFLAAAAVHLGDGTLFWDSFQQEKLDGVLVMFWSDGIFHSELGILVC